MEVKRTVTHHSLRSYKMSTINLTSRRAPSFRTMGNKGPESLDLTPRAFQIAKGLDWTISKEEIAFNMIQTAGLENYRAVVRSDNGKAVGVVGKDYAVVQNDEIFSFLTDLAQFDLEVKMVAGGALGGGEIVWALARVPSLALDFKGDNVDTLLMVSNGHAGNATLKVDAYTMRKICSNGMHALTVDKSGLTIGKGWNLKHTVGISDRFAQAQGVLKNLAKDHATTLATFEALAGIPATFQTVEELHGRIYGAVPPEREGKNANKGRNIKLNRLADLREIWESPTNKGLETQDTLWTAVNTLTEWMEHESITREGNYTQEESRLKGNYLDGTAASYKEKAYSYALTMAGLR